MGVDVWWTDAGVMLPVVTSGKGEAAPLAVSSEGYPLAAVALSFDQLLKVPPQLKSGLLMFRYVVYE